MRPMKVILADDEILVRLGIRSVIDWNRHGFEYAGDAPDGAEALDLIRRTKPDIVLTDIVMPNMNGLELIQAIKRSDPGIRIIVLSSHNEYDYLRQAMKLGVDDYILKASMKPEELLALLLETADKIAAEREEADAGPIRSQQRKESEGRDRLAQTIHRWIGEDSQDTPQGVAGSDRDIAEDEEEIPLAANNMLLLLRVHPQPPNSAGEPLELHTLIDLAELEMRKWLHGYALPYNDHTVLLLIPIKEPLPEQDGIVEGLCGDIVSALKRFLAASVSIGVSEPFADRTGLKKAYWQARQALERYFYEGTEKVYRYAAETELSTKNGEPLFTKEDERELRNRIELLDETGMKRIVGRVLGSMRENRRQIDLSIQICLALLHHLQAGLKKFDEALFAEGEGEPLYKQVIAFQELHEAERWFDRLIDDAADRAREALKKTYREEIQQLILQMKQNYAEDWSLKQAARMANMSESYLSYLFKKETGVGFAAYINNIRVEKAVEYLRETNWPAYVIGEKVGYDNINYFGRVFKKLIGLSPQQYRMQFQLKGNEHAIPKH
ncbi:response regulator [Paenibacillus sp. MSJ-34]|uniref:response regulator n=1 Tax=Paenibacillus sp. MSJ-34 TaxID=2841529 RepID=UPI001C12655C|nr:response regulator [Paenibacillus sp. MSJ-34]MBU5443939.1 response regulator [Paenibacillus sp. MSJ-34]